MLLSLRKNGLTSLFKEVRVFKAFERWCFSVMPVLAEVVKKTPSAVPAANDTEKRRTSLQQLSCWLESCSGHA